MQDGRAPEPNRPEEPFAEADDPVVGAVALLVLGAGLGSLFGLPVLAAVDFWVIFVIGYAVVVPLVSLLRGRGAESTDQPRDSEVVSHEESNDIDAALDRLRDRYARGELSEAQFERKLETLLETETPEDARERVDREGIADSRTDDGNPSDAERETERDR